MVQAIKTIAVFGSSSSGVETPDYQDGLKLGASLAESGFAVMSGGYGGLMAAISEGAASVNGHVIGITCGVVDNIRAHSRPNQWLVESVHYETLSERVTHLITYADGYLMLPGGLGTLHELVTAWELMRTHEVPLRPMVGYGEYWRKALASFYDNPHLPMDAWDMVQFADTPEAVVQAFQ